MSEHIRAIQRSICLNLVDSGKLTAQQADTMPVSEDTSKIVPDIWRVCKDDEAVCQAIAKHMRKECFTRVEDGVNLILGSEGEHWIIYGDTMFLTNPFDRRQNEKAAAYSRIHNTGATKIGVISLSKIEQLKAISTSADGVDQNDKVAAEIHAKQRIDDLVREAAKLDASDIHLQPSQGDQIQVRMRIDGELITKRMYPLSAHESICRVLMEGYCNQTVEMHTTQDGKFDFDLTAHKKINLRVNSLPCTKSSDKVLKIVMRLLGNNTQLGSIDKLGMSDANKAMLRRFGEAPNGLIVLTGPTGSGKTTTLNALMMDIFGREPNKNYHTIEDPVEIQHEGMSHTECNNNLSFAQALRALLRQDPDVILVGEMRDDETAELGYKASMTGHLVLTTLHTNNSHESISRLERMNIPSDIITSNTTAFVAQRLVRALCSKCKVEYLFKSDAKRFEIYGSDKNFNMDGDLRLFRANRNGCKACNPDDRKAGGLKGRRGIIEILEVTPSVQEAILAGVSPSVLRRSQLANGTFEDLWTDGLRLVKDGVVGFEQLEAELRPYISDRVGGRLAIPLVEQLVSSPVASKNNLVAQL